MKARNAVILGGAVLGTAAAAVGAYRATHPSGVPLAADPGRRRRPPTDDRYDLPPDVVHHALTTDDGGTVHAIERGSASLNDGALLCRTILPSPSPTHSSSPAP